MSIIYEEDSLSGSASAALSNSGKPGVLLIGDSIRLGYCNYTKECLKDIAEVRFPDENCRFTQDTFVRLGAWRNLFENSENVKIVCWNNGHWDIAHWDGDEYSLNTVEVYSYMLVRIYKKIKSYFPNAKVIFQTTSPMNPNGSMGINPRYRYEIEEYNKAAKKVLGEYNILIDDVYDFLKDEPESLYADYCHLTEAGFKKLGEHTADFIKKIL